ncbi:uncharacterized protein MEPE_01106 [Melanopsichium pennsylvanicum]|uniref:Uncharacterized protein n=2 Tax=Melanopsichium pennsylvanicum TaxID=63383 RepID=A0AAJ4XH71_9BASI|nr:uncharacterized protein MEPE_01106 [Melanopsichium pennsylvanicum]
MQSNGRLEPLDAYDARDMPPRRHDITPEVFRRFMTYERTLVANDTSPSIPQADFGSTSPLMEAGLLPSEGQGPARRRIRGMPKRVHNAPRSTSIEADACKRQAHINTPAVLPRLVTEHDTFNPSGRSDTSLRSPDHPSARTQSENQGTKGSPVASHALSQRFEQLHVTPQERTQSDTDAAEMPDTAENGDSGSDTHFRFPRLPAKLTDDGFHYRQRAAQFILLYSQQASPEKLSKYNRLSSPLSYGPYESSKTAANSRRTNGASRASSCALESTNCSTTHQDDESIHSHHRNHNATDDESEYLDFDACRTAHLGNKKKRKSSRFSSPGLPVFASVSTLDKSLSRRDLAQHGTLLESPRANEPGKDRALVDTTNVSRLTGSQLQHQHKPIGGYAPSSHPFSIRFHTLVRLPPRQSSGEHQRLILRGRIRARLAPIFQQRRLKRIEEGVREEREYQARQQAREAQAKFEADAYESTTPEKRAPPRRVNKAGKRAQAIRGSSSAAKPLTIAEIRAKAAAAASGGAFNATTVYPVKTIGSASPKQIDSQTKDASPKVQSKMQPSLSPERSASKPNSHAYELSKMQSTQSESWVASAAAQLASEPKLSLPTSLFDFRMSSAVTLRLRELRSQLDVATHNLSDTVRQGDTHAEAKAFSEAVVASPSAPAPGLTTRSVAATIQNDGPSDALQPWVRDEYQHRLVEQQQMTSQSRSPANTPASVSPSLGAPRPSNVDSSTSRQTRHPPSAIPAKPSSAAPSRTGATSANGRRTLNNRATNRKPSESAHKHTAACKHGTPRQHGNGSALFTDDDWICIFCEYELYYGEAPLMLRACRNRKKLVENKSKAKTKAQAALSKKSSSAKPNGSASSGGYGHSHDHDDHEHHQGCEHDHEHTCHHDHGSSYGGSDDHYHDHHHHHRHGDDVHHQSYRHSGDDDVHRERCDCGNSIHSSDFDDEDK